MKMNFHNLFLFENKSCSKSCVSLRKCSELNSVLSGLPILKKRETFLQQSSSIFHCHVQQFSDFCVFLRCFLKYTAEETNNKKEKSVNDERISLGLVVNIIVRKEKNLQVLVQMHCTESE